MSAAGADLCKHVNLLDSLLDAIVRLDGDALVMHVGEKPYVVTTSEAMNQFRGPLAWGQVELSTRVLTSDAVAGMLGQILPLDQRVALEEYGATEYEVGAANHPEERFTIVAARGGDDIWVEMRRQPTLSAEAAAAIAELRDEPPVSPAEESVEHDEEAPSFAEHQPAALNEPAADDEIPDLAPAAEADGVIDMGEIEVVDEEQVEVEVRVPILNETHQLDEQDPAEEVTLLAAVEEVGPPADVESEPLPVALIAHDMAPEDPPVRHDHHTSDADEPISIDLDPDRDATEDLLTIDTDYDGGILRGSQHWNDDVMTEGELGELLRATAAAVIAGEINREDHPPVSAGAADSGTAQDSPDGVGIVEPAAAEPIAVDGQSSDRPPVHEPAFARATEELPALVEYQIKRDAATELAPAAARPVSEAEVIGGESARAGAASQGQKSGAEDAAASAPIQTVDTVEEHREVLAEVETGPDDGEQAAPSRPAAVVLPLTRQTRVETGDARASVATTLQRLLRLAAARGAGTVYVVGHSAPLIRVDGEFSSLEGEPALSGAFVERLMSEVAPATRGTTPAAEWLIDVPEIGRVRCVTFRDHRGPGVIFRMVPARAIAADQLALPAEVQALCSEADGLVLVTGARGSGKSTLLTSFVDLINRTRSDHVITAEPQIDFVHEPKRSFISQREVRGEDAMVSAVRAASREEPDVLVIEDVRSQDLATLAIDAAESGRLVFASVPGLSTTSALERLIELFPAERREKVQASLAATLRGVVSQVLLRKLRGGRVTAREVLINTPAVASLIAEGKIFQLPAALDSGRGAGMISLAESLASLVREGTVHPAHAYRKAPNREQFLVALRRSGVDTAVAERLG
jgi:twitching motility protein PilT